MISGCRLFTENQVGCFWRTLWSEGLLCFVCCVCELYMLSLKTRSCSTLFSLVEARQGWRDQGTPPPGGGLGKGGKKTDHPSPLTSYPVNFSLVRNMLTRTRHSGTDCQESRVFGILWNTCIKKPKKSSTNGMFKRCISVRKAFFPETV